MTCSSANATGPALGIDPAAARLADLGLAGIADRLRRGDLVLDIGVVRTRLVSPLPELAAWLLALYGGFPLADPQAFAEHRLNVGPSRPWRRHLRRDAIQDVGFSIPLHPVPAHQAPLTLETGLNLLMAFREYRFLLFHAGSLLRGDAAVLLPGASGSGKSTLSAGLAAAGWTLLSDEFGLLDPANGMLAPCPRPISIKNAAIELVAGLWGDAPRGEPISGTPKGRIGYFSVPRPAPAGLRARPRLIAFPSFDPGATARAKRISPGRAFARLIASSPNYRRLGEPAFAAMVDLVRTAPAFELDYSSLAEGMEMVETLLERPA